MKKLKIPAALAAKLDGMDRRARFRAIRMANGLCANCGKEPLASAQMGAKCLELQRERMRKRTGAKGRYPGSRSYARLRKP